MFMQDEIVLMNIKISSNFVLGTFMTMNLTSFIKVHINGIVQEYSSNTKMAGKLMLILSILLGSLIRISSIVLYFSPILGLFQLLHHYQGIYQIQLIIKTVCQIYIYFFFYFPAEMFGFEIFDPSNTGIHHIVPISNKTSSLASLQRGTYSENGQENGVHVYIYEPPAIELYTTFSLATYFLSFWGILFFQTLVIIILDKVWIKTIPNCATLWERIIHAIVKSHFAFPYENWHETVGNCQDHRDRQKAAKHEVLVTMFINLVFNMAMLVPLVILCKSNFVAKIFFNVTMLIFDDICRSQNP